MMWDTPLSTVCIVMVLRGDAFVAMCFFPATVFSSSLLMKQFDVNELKACRCSDAKWNVCVQVFRGVQS